MMRYSEKTIEKRGRPIKNVDMIKALRKTGNFDNLEATFFSTTLLRGIKARLKAIRYARVLSNEFGIECTPQDVLGMREIIIETKIQLVDE